MVIAKISSPCNCRAWDASQTMPKSSKSEKAGTHWLNVGASVSVPIGHVIARRPGPTGWAPRGQCQGHVRDASQTMPKSMREREGRDPLAERGRYRMPGVCNGKPVVQAVLKMRYEVSRRV